MAEQERKNIRFRTMAGRDEARLVPTAKADKLPYGINFVRHDPRRNIGVFTAFLKKKNG